MGLAQPNDKFLINRSNTSYQVTQADLMAKIQASDYMLLNRGNVTYKISGDDVIDSFIPDLFLDEVILSTFYPVARSTISVTLDAGGGQPPYIIQYQWEQWPENGSTWVNIPGATSASMYIPDALVGSQLTCTVTITDNRGNSETKSPSAVTDKVQPFVKKASLASVDITQTTSGARFTNQEFEVRAQFAEPGIPVAVKKAVAFVEGRLAATTDLAPIASYVADPVSYNFSWGTDHPDDPWDEIPPQDYYQPQPQDCLDKYGPGPITPEQEPAMYLREHTAPIFGDGRGAWYIDFVLPEPTSFGRDFPENYFYLNFIPGAAGWRRLWLNGDWDPSKGHLRHAIDYEFVSYDGLQTKTMNSYGEWGIDSSKENIVNATVIRIEQQMHPAPDAARNPFTDELGISFMRSNIWVPYSQGGNIPNDGTGRNEPIGDGIFRDNDFIPKLTFVDNRNFDQLEVGTVLQENGGSGYGQITKIDSATSTVWLDRNRPTTNDYNGTSQANHSWQAGNSVATENRPDPATKKYLVFNNNGDVLDLSTTEPQPTSFGTANTTDFDIQFPATLPSGMTPDNELLPGTRLTVRIYGQNEAGTSNSLSDTILPGTTRMEDLTAEESEASRLQSLTYSIRKNDASRQAQIQALLDEGYTQAEIDAVL